jgi:hypothetical protein
MKITTRYIDGVLVVDMIDAFPNGDHEIEIWRTSLDRALEGHSGRVILNIQEPGLPESMHLGTMIGALSQAGIHHDSVSFVTPNEGFRSVLNSGCMLRWGAYQTVDEALRPPPSGSDHGCLVGCILIIVGIISGLCIGVYFLIRALFG